MKKRGLSTVVTTLILILLVLVAVGIVWVVIANVIKEGVDEVSLGRFTISLDIKSVSVNSDSIDVKVKRNSGAGELTGIKFLVSDGLSVYEFEEATEMGELGQKTFTLNYDGLVKEISIVPILKSESGKELFGSVIDMKEFNNEEIIENLGGVSWWRFEGNANDEIGGNDGTLNGGVDCGVEGKFGKACEFDGVDDYVDIPHSMSISIGPNSPFTISYLLFVHNTSWWTVLGKGGYSSAYGHYISANSLYVYTDDDGNVEYSSDNVSQVNEWAHIVQTYDGNQIRVYSDGELKGTSSGGITLTTNTASLQIGGDQGIFWFNGLIDEPMIFNRALSENEVKALYELDLS